jgi:hypothetical protein
MMGHFKQLIYQLTNQETFKKLNQISTLFVKYVIKTLSPKITNFRKNSIFFICKNYEKYSMEQRSPDKRRYYCFV